MRRMFALPEQDRHYLETTYLLWETVIEGSQRWLVVNNFPVPSGYQSSVATAALMLDATYPDTPLDMVYFYPPLQLSSGRQVGALADQPFDGKTYQRWSRHRTGENPWRPGLDDIGTHFALVQHWLERETLKGAVA